MIERKPFERTRLEEEGQEDTVNVRLNPACRVLVDEMKRSINCDNDSTVLKFYAAMGLKCCTLFFGRKNLERLFKNKRPKMEDVFEKQDFL